MEKRNLGNIKVSPIGTGCMGFSYGQIPDERYSIEVHGHRGFDEAEGRSFLSRK